MSDNQKLVIFELVDKRETSFRRETSDGSQGDALDSAAQRIIPSTSVEVKNNGEHVRLRYVKGCQYLELDKQEKNGIKPSILGADTIAYQFGKLILVDAGDDKVKIDYLRRIVLNEKNSHLKSGIIPIFKELVEEKEAENSLEEYFTVDLVRAKLSELTSPLGKGKFKYDEDKIDFYCKILGLAGYEAMEYSIKLKALYDYSTLKPKEFLDKIADEKSITVVLVKEALSKGIVEFDLNAFKFVDGMLITKVADTEDNDEKIDQAVDFLLKGSSAKFLNDINYKVKEAQV